jgi:hypothetical protein
MAREDDVSYVEGRDYGMSASEKTVGEAIDPGVYTEST